MKNTVPTSSEVAIVSGRLRAVFDRRDDRWGHRVEWCSEDGRALPLLKSVDGSPHDDELPSPPLQELHVQQIAPGVEAALGVGASGRNHWSVSLTPDSGPDERPMSDVLRFSLACRLRENVPQLLCTYRLIPPAQVAHFETRSVVITGQGIKLRVQSDQSLRPADDCLAIVAGKGDQVTPCTLKWSYCIGYEGPQRQTLHP